jgi:hypothetical protein
MADAWRIRKLIAINNQFTPRLSGSIDEFLSVLDADILYAVWRDPAEPDGVGMRFVKGQALARLIGAGNAAVKPRPSKAIVCADAEEAQALIDVAGDKGQPPLRLV